VCSPENMEEIGQNYLWANVIKLRKKERRGSHFKSESSFFDMLKFQTIKFRQTQKTEDFC